MGKLSPSLRPGDDAVSLHTQSDRYLDDDAPELVDDDLPPLYEEAAASSSSSAPLLPAAPAQAHPAAYVANLAFHQRDANTGSEFCIDRRLDNDPKFLARQVEAWAETPPRPFVRMVGTHRETVDNKGKKERKSVVDFDIWVELTPYLYSDATHHAAWKELRAVENSDKVRRGTVLRKRAPGAKQSLEVGLPDKPTLEEWYHRYCASHTGLKCFAVQRRMVGFDEARLKEKLQNMIRATNYRGSLDITFPVKDGVIQVYNDCKTNQWRLTTWVFWLCIFTLMFLFTWPYLFFRTKRFEVVFVDWHFSRLGDNDRREFVSISEDQLYNMWGRAINRAVLSKRQGTLDQTDLQAAEGADPTFANPIVDGAVSFVRAGISAMNEVNRQLGWGYDT
ncbi:hypothetical protein GQ53DRAFT_832186 [Thozetella sp. PMI_491]|nr:hypothetical protein GQ53DRAFT_832186 [Thozetella sp. PMI_491]